MFKSIPTNECVVEITPRNAHRERTAREEYAECESIVSDIRRHIDNVGHVTINQRYEYEDASGNTFSTLYDALDAHFNNEQVYRYTFTYQRPNDTYGTRAYADTFRELIESAYRNPWAFEVVYANPPLSESQRRFVDSVIVARVEASV
jgi:hypothetical protein